MSICRAYTNTSKTRIRWRVPVQALFNTPVLEGDTLIIHLDKVTHQYTMLVNQQHVFQTCELDTRTPVIITSTNTDKLKSLQLAIEYALLLNMPYRPVDSVSFQS